MIINGKICDGGIFESRGFVEFALISASANIRILLCVLYLNLNWNNLHHSGDILFTFHIFLITTFI